MKILHTADLHIKDSVIDEGIRVLGSLVERAKTEKPDLIVIAGDLTHRNDVKWDSKTSRLLVVTVEALADIAPVVIVKGNTYHEGDIPEMLGHIKADFPVHVSLYPEQIFLTEDAFGDRLFVDGDEQDIIVHATISLLPCPTKAFLEAQTDFEIADGDTMIQNGMGQILAMFGAKASPVAPHILVGHWSVGGAYISEKQQMIGRDIEINQGQIKLANADLVCLGHIHKKQKIGDNIFYPGSIYSLTAGELDQKGFYIHEVGGESKFVPVPATVRLIIDADFTNGHRIEDMEAIINRYSTGEIHGSIVHARFRVWDDELAKIDQEAIKANFTGAQDIKVEITRVPRANVRSETFMKLRTLREKVVEQARIKDEDLPAGVPMKVEALESMLPAKVFESLPV